MNADRVALVGSGETAKRVAEILASRRDLEIAGCFSHHAAGEMSCLGKKYLRPDWETILKKCSLTLLCTKDQTAMDLVPQLLRSADHRCIDISGAYRVPWKDHDFQRIYGFPHTDLGRSCVYGLPELQERPTLRKARLIATAGTVSTAVLLAAVPLAIDRIIEPGTPLSIEASCGASAFSVCDRLAGGIDRSDGAMEHESEERHKPEIRYGFHCFTRCELNLEALSITMSQLKCGVEAKVRFNGVESRLWAEAQRCYQKTYPREGLVRIPAYEQVNSLHLMGTHFCELSQDRREEELVVIARLDNLGKGGPGQLVQNLNIALGKDPVCGLL